MLPLQVPAKFIYNFTEKHHWEAGSTGIQDYEMQLLELFDETLDINSTENYELSIQVSDHNLSFCILDTIRNKYILLRSFNPDNSGKFGVEQIDEIIGRDDFLTREYRNTNIIVPSPKYTLVPVPLYDPAKKDEYFSLNHVHPENSVILNNKLKDPESYLLYAVHRPFLDLIKKYYPVIQPFHHLLPLFYQISLAKKNSTENHINVHVEADFFNLVIFNNQNLNFSNSFTYRNISDILYFILNVFKNLGIKQEETIHLSGQTERYDDLYSNLSLYIRNVSFSEPSGSFTFSYVFNETDLHKYLNLFTITSCAL